jgi:hypothetical protein
MLSFITVMCWKTTTCVRLYICKNVTPTIFVSTSCSSVLLCPSVFVLSGYPVCLRGLQPRKCDLPRHFFVEMFDIAILHNSSMLNSKMLVTKLDVLFLEFYSDNQNNRTHIHMKSGFWIQYVGWWVVEVKTAAILRILIMLNLKMAVSKQDFIFKGRYSKKKNDPHNTRMLE